MLNVCGTTFISNAFRGGFCIFESMATVLSVVDEFHVVDFGSVDGTLEILREIANKNKRIHIHQRAWTKTNDSSTFADAANECCNICPTENVLFYQADEVFHENLMSKIKEKYQNNEYSLNFERIQLSHGMHVVKWLPHACVRSIAKSKYKYANDGMTVGDSGGTFMMCRNPVTGVFGNSRQFPWHEPKPGMFFDGKNPTALNAIIAKAFPWDEFLVDTSSSFRDCQAGKKELHAPFWRETPNIVQGMKNEEWLRREKMNSLWEKKEPSFPLPKIIQGLVGMTKYELRPEIKEALEKDDYTVIMGCKI